MLRVLRAAAQSTVRVLACDLVRSRDPVCPAAQSAVRHVSTTQLFIDGKFVDSKTSKWIDVHNPVRSPTVCAHVRLPLTPCCRLPER
jgi:hypothetical protein